jgi:ferredoxin
LASKSSIALDIAGSRIIKYKPKKIYAVREAVKRKLYPNYKIDIRGMEKLVKINFKKPASYEKTKRLITRLFREKPIICNTEKCIKCRMCAKHCPVKAITLNPYPVIDKKKCIRCFCCMEICPQDALSLEK